MSPSSLQAVAVVSGTRQAQFSTKLEGAISSRGTPCFGKQTLSHYLLAKAHMVRFGLHACALNIIAHPFRWASTLFQQCAGEWFAEGRQWDWTKGVYLVTIGRLESQGRFWLFPRPGVPRGHSAQVLLKPWQLKGWGQGESTWILQWWPCRVRAIASSRIRSLHWVFSSWPLADGPFRNTGGQRHKASPCFLFRLLSSGISYPCLDSRLQRMGSWIFFFLLPQRECMF